MTRLTPVLLALLLGCKSNPTEPTQTDADTDTDTDADTDTDTDTDTDADADTDTDTDTDADTDTDPVPTSCKDAGGICVAQGACASQSGTELPSFAADCTFDDGPGSCCSPPAAQPSGETCPDHGGVCAPIAGCNFVDGSFAPASDSCPSVIEVCCLPESVCGVEDSVCCGATVAFRPSCDRGTWSCDLFPDTELMLESDCDV